METSTVRNRLRDTIERAKRGAADRRAAADAAARDYGEFLQDRAIPLFRQLANALKVAGYPFVVNTPADSVTLVSERAASDAVELSLDTSGDEPLVILRTSRSRGRKRFESERPVGKGPISSLSDELLLEVLLKELEPFVEK
jgi:hypothetical protein